MRSPSAAISAAFVLCSSSAPAATWVVDPSGSGDATTIQGGIDLASPGDSVTVLPGTYFEGLRVATDDLTVIGLQGAAATVLDASEGGTLGGACVFTSLYDDVERSVWAGLTFTGAVSGYGSGALYALRLRGDVEIRDCIVRDNTIYGWALVGSAGDLTLRNTLFADNTRSPDAFDRAAVDWQGGGDVDIDSCRFERNSTGANSTGGVIDARSGDASIRNSVFLENWGGWTFVRGMNVALEGNLFVRNGGGLSCSLLRLEHNTFSGHSFRVDYFPVQEGSAIRANVFTGSSVGLPLPPGGGGIVVECNDSWGNTVNWSGHDPSGENGNFSAPPGYCDPEGGDFTVAANSPLLPENNSCGVLIGALGAGCGAVSIDPTTWADIKSRYRTGTRDR